MKYHVEVFGYTEELRIFVFNTLEEAIDAFRNFYETDGEDLDQVYQETIIANAGVTITDENGLKVYEDDIRNDLDIIDFEEGKYYVEVDAVSKGMIIEDDFEVDEFNKDCISIGDSSIEYEDGDNIIEIEMNGDTYLQSNDIRLLDSNGNEIEVPEE